MKSLFIQYIELKNIEKYIKMIFSYIWPWDPLVAAKRQQ